jgi:hypothetical protein
VALAVAITAVAALARNSRRARNGRAVSAFIGWIADFSVLGFIIFPLFHGAKNNMLIVNLFSVNQNGDNS